MTQYPSNLCFYCSACTLFSLSRSLALGFCEDGHAKGQADDRRVAALAAEFRAQQASPSTVTKQAYAARQMADKLYSHSCHHESTQFNEMPAVAAAMMRY
jgi:hypothetical protein